VRESDAAGASSSFIATDVSVPLSTDVAAGHAFLITVDGAIHSEQAQPTVFVVNRYQTASLVITKEISSAAVDQEGTAIEYGPFPVEVFCEFEGDPVYETPDGTVLEPGIPLEITGLVRGAECTVTELDQMDAAGTTIRTEIAGVGLSRPGTSATVVLASDSGGESRNLVEIDNAYDSGSVTLAKITDGDGDAWEPETFAVHLICVLDDATGERTVWDEAFALVAGDDPIQLDGIAAGAECTITETATGGANATSVSVDGVSTAGTSATFTSAADDTLPVTVRNTFSLATVTVTKERTGGWDLWGDGPFEVSLQCTRDVDGSTVPVTVPGGATRELASPAYAADYEGLPLDAECELTETRSGGATASTLPDVFAVDAVETEVALSNDFAEGSIDVTKTVTGDGSLLYGEGPFVVTLQCTRDVDGTDTAIEIPFGETRTLDADNGYADSFTRLPAGAECVLEETGTGGASVAADPVSVTVVADEAVDVALSNEFQLGMLIVTNKVTGSDGPAHEHLTFVVELACTLDVNGKDRSIEIPGGASREILHLESIEYVDLPVGAECELTETVTNNAEEVIIEPGETSKDSTVSRRTISSKVVSTSLTTLSIGLEPVRFDVVNVYTLALPNTGRALPPIVPIGLAGLLVAFVGVAIVAADRRRRRS